MRIKHRMPAGHLEESADYVVVKTRSATPEQGGFWLHPLEGCNETGFINSQPSMAEFMTALPHVPVGGGGGEVVPMSPQHTPPPPPPSGPAGYPMEVPHGLESPGVNVPEYPWMKEKKTTRKSSQQGKIAIFPFRDIVTSYDIWTVVTVVWHANCI